jgi:hypothetical protein
MPGNQDYFGGISDSRDRRRHQRQLSSLNYIKLGESNGGILMNVSEDGLAFTAAQTIAGEFIRRLRFQLAAKSEWIEASGRIIWLNDTRKAAGIQFVDISDADREQIRRWIESQNLLEEIEETVSAPPKIRKEKEVTPFPAPKHDAKEIETQYEMLQPDIQKMFPSESVLRTEGAHSDSARAQREALSEIPAAPPGDYFPSENGPRQAAPTPAPQAQIPAAVREARRGESFSENAHPARTAEPRFGQALQVETLPEIHQDHHQQSPPTEVVGPLEESEESEPRDSARAVRVPNFGYGAGAHPERSAVPVARTSQFEASDLTGRATRVPSFGYQTSGDEKQEDWTNWVDPATETHRSKLGFVVIGVLLVVAAFAIGMAFGHGSLEEFADSIRQYLPDKYRQEPNATIPGASPVATPSAGAEQTKADAPGQAQSNNTESQATATPANSNSVTPPAEPVASSSNDKDVQPAAASSDAEGAAAGESKSADTVGSSAPILMAPAGGGKEPFRLTTPEEAISASSSVAISSQTTVIVPREAGAGAAQEPKRLQPGGLVFRVDPQYPKKIGRGEVEIVRLLATVGENGQVLNVQRITGTAPFASVAISAVREWRYSPTLFDGRPVKTEERITIVFRR